MKPTSIITTSAPVLTLLLAMLAVVPWLNAEAGPPETVFVQLDSEKPDPSIDAEATSLPNGEWLMSIDVDGFAFSDICAFVGAGEPVGHAHVYSGDKKIATAYQPILSLGNLTAGEHIFRIVLRARDHRALVGSNGLIEQEVRVVVG